MKRNSIGLQLALGFACVLVLLLTTSGIGLWRLQDTAKSTEAMMELPLTKERLVSDWYATINGGVRRTIAIARSADPSLAAFFAEDASSASKASSESQKRIEELLRSEPEKRVFAELGEHRKQFVTLRDRITQLKKDGDETQALGLLEQQFLPAAKAYLDSLKALQQLQREELDARAQDIARRNARSAWLLWGLGGTALLVGMLISWRITRRITAPLHSAVEAAQRVARGDLSLPVHSERHDELGLLLCNLEEMRQQLTEVVARVRANADGVSTASAEIAQGNLDLSQRTERQASVLQQTSATMVQFKGTVGHNAGNAQQAKQLSAGASDIALRGGQVVQEVVNTMREIQQSSHQISDIIGVIDGIAFQTNILALNAAVEAARAGEQGRGFAVVAGEVRQLAQRSADAAKQIKSLISRSLAQVENGASLVDRAGGTMTEVVGAVQRVSDIVAEISAASQEQSQGVNQIGQTVAELDEATQHNAALVEQSAAAAESLKNQAHQLVSLVEVFKLAGTARASAG